MSSMVSSHHSRKCLLLDPVVMSQHEHQHLLIKGIMRLELFKIGFLPFFGFA